MTGIRRFFTVAHRDDRGLGLPEMLVAMVIFALISTGVLYGLLAMLQLSRESRAIQVASNLAAEEIDLVRDVDDIFSLVDATRTVELNGDTFEIRRTQRWVSDPGLDLACGSGGAAGQPLRYKAVTVEVRWGNMRDAANPVSSHTIIDPDTRINDPALGTILVNVVNASGTGSAGVTITATPASPPNGAVPLTTAPLPTDAQGCSYVLRVRPGDYNVRVNSAGFLSPDQVQQSTRFVTVSAGQSTSVDFLYDRSGTIQLTYAPDSPTLITGVILPRNFTTSFVSTYGIHQSVNSTNTSLSRNVPLFPFPSGYHVIPGAFALPNQLNNGCLAVDPATWEPRVDGAQTFVGRRAGEVGAVPGGSAPITVPIGVVEVRGPTIGRFLRVQSVDGDGPGCAVQMNYVFEGQVIPNGTGAVRIGLPFGTWRFFSGTTQDTQATEISIANITPLTLGQKDGLLGLLPGTVTLDPRTVLQ